MMLSWASGSPPSRATIRSSPDLTTVRAYGRSTVVVPISLVAILSLAVAPPTSGQVIQGQVVDSVARTAVGAGFVVLVGPDAREITRTLTTSDGRFTFQIEPEQPGPLHLRSERIGYRMATTEPFSVPADGFVDVVIWVRALPTQLSEIEVQAASECRMRPEENERTSVVWEEARKALDAASWTASQNLFYIVSNVYRRDMDRRGRLVKPERHWPHRAYSASPFVSRDPLELLQSGYVIDRVGSTDYYAPDAEVLRDPGFVETHCFRLTRHDDDADLIGLAFEPAPTRDLPDVRGVLWLDRQSAELRSLEYEYANLPRVLRTRSDPGGGTLEFMSLPSGAWIVCRWEIRIPTAFRSERIDRFDREARQLVDALRDDGGEVLTVTDSAGTRVYEAELAELIAIVGDSLDGRTERLAGASVRIDGTWFEGITDQHGIVRIRAPLDGDYGVTFSDRTTDALGYHPTSGAVTLARGRTDTVWLQPPSMEDMLERLCERPVAGPTFRVLVGSVLDSATRQPVSDALVTATWQHVEENFRFQTKYATSTTDGSGFYAICGLEFARPTLVYAEHSNGRSDLVRVAFEPDGVEVGNEFHSMQEPFFRRNFVLQPRSLRTTMVWGLATDAVTAEPLPDVVVTIDGAGAAVVTDSAGVFRFEDPPTGAHRITFTKRGYAGRSGSVEIDDDRSTVVGAPFSAMTPVPQAVGIVEEPATKRPIPRAWLTLIDTDGESVAITRSDTLGNFVLTAPTAGSYFVAARRIGYGPETKGPIELTPGQGVAVPFSLSPLAQMLDPISVVADAAVPFLEDAGFYDRRGRELGFFLDRAAIRQRGGASKLSHLLVGAPGVRIDRYGFIRVRGIGSQCEDKPPAVWVDGVRLLVDPSFGVNEDWHEMIHPMDMEAVEVYTRPVEIPAEYNTGGDAACGVILIWTRRGGN